MLKAVIQMRTMSFVSEAPGSQKPCITIHVRAQPTLSFSPLSQSRTLGMKHTMKKQHMIVCL